MQFPVLSNGIFRAPLGMTIWVFAKIQQTVRKIPYGKVSTYGDVAYAAGFPGAARQVVWALHGGRGLPWHRVVGADGKILLPGEAGFEQRVRLKNEGVEFRGIRVNMDTHQHIWFARKKKSKPQRSKKARGPSTRRKAGRSG